MSDAQSPGSALGPAQGPASAPAPAPPRRRSAGLEAWLHRARLATGLVLLAYLVTHLANHALGLISLGAMEAGRLWFTALWAGPPGLVLLLGSLSVHLGLALWALYRRRSLLRMRRWEAAQLLLGLAVPPLLAIHVLGTVVSALAFGTHTLYAYLLLVLWVFSPDVGLQQAIVVLVAWTHGCIGLHFWLRLKPWYAAWRPYLFAAALLLPVLSLLGFVEGGRAVARLYDDPAWMAALQARVDFPSQAQVDALYRWEHQFFLVYAGLLAAILLARLGRDLLHRRFAVVIGYGGGRRVEVARGTTILEASRIGGIPHAAVCGGRGRCSTCRVRVTEGLVHLPAASAEERRVLDRVGAAPNVRLACQTRPTHNCAVVPLLPPAASPADAGARPGYLQGREEEIAVLFADLRSFTQFAEHRLPYDVVFLLNRYFRAMGTAVEEAGGQVDKFIGDGVMALFGVGGKGAEGCRAALAAARRMAENLEEMNRALAHDLPTPLRIGIGINVGPVIVGEMGYARATSVTAIGDTVNTASRLETLTKDYRCQLIVAEQVAERAGVDLGAFPQHEIEVRGRVGTLAVRAVADARQLPEPAAPAVAPRPVRHRGRCGRRPASALCTPGLTRPLSDGGLIAGSSPARGRLPTLFTSCHARA
ncbi:MAG: adenylate/guanylate cyclase domain-containing protein [Dongiaceae bacterium]